MRHVFRGLLALCVCVQRLLAQPLARPSLEDATADVVRCFGDDECVVESESVSLKDWCTWTLMQTPIKGRDCRHVRVRGSQPSTCLSEFSGSSTKAYHAVQGLDLEGYLQWLQSRKNGATPSCPLCHKPMYIDEVKVMDCSLPGLRELRHSTTMADSL